MIDFTKLSDEKLLGYVWLWDNCPSTKLLIKTEIYELAVKEIEIRGLKYED